MSWTRWTACVASILASGSAIVALSCAPAGTGSAKVTPEEKIARGEYLTTIAGCNDCHTPGTLFGAPDFTRKLSGSELGWRGPWGVTYASNLTPDEATGLGAWTEDQIVTALRSGHRPDGSVLLPPMPWQAYSVMTDEDAYAIAAYLKSLPAIDHSVPDRVPPDGQATGSILEFPPPPAWDAPPSP